MSTTLIEPAIKYRTGCYGELALDVLSDCYSCDRTIDTHNNVGVHIAPDSEILYIEWEGKPVMDSTVKRRIAKALERYVETAKEFETPKPFVDGAECLKLILRGRDEKAKTRWPDVYEKLKGKQLNPIQVAAIEAIMAEGDRLDVCQGSDSFVEYSLREVFKYGLPLDDLDDYPSFCGTFSREKRRLAKKMLKIRGW